MKQITRFSHLWSFPEFSRQEIEDLNLGDEKPLTIEECLEILKLKNDTKIEQ